MSRRIIRPYDRRDDEKRLDSGFIALVASVVLHLGALVAFIILGSMQSARITEDQVIRVKFIGGDETSVETPTIKTDPPAGRTEQTTAKTDPPTGKTEQTTAKIDPPAGKTEQTTAKTDPPTGRTEQTTAKTGTSTDETSEIPANLDGAIDNVISRLEKQRGSEGDHIDKEREQYYRYIQDIISRNWLAPADGGSSDIAATYKIIIEPDGQVSLSLLLESSNNDSFDSSVTRAVQASSFPPLPEVFNGRAVPVRLKFSLNELRRSSGVY